MRSVITLLLTGTMTGKMTRYEIYGTTTGKMIMIILTTNRYNDNKTILYLRVFRELIFRMDILITSQ